MFEDGVGKGRCDDHHTLAPIFFLALPPILGPLLLSLLRCSLPLGHGAQPGPRRPQTQPK